MDWFVIAVIILFSLAYFFRRSNTIYLSASETKKGVEKINEHLKEFRYFQNLSSAGKSKFIKRVVHFINSKKFIGHHGLHVTGEMRVLIASSAVQLTFGLKKYILTHYHTIRLYPEAFYSRMLDAHLKGGTSEGGTISLSWADFKDGYADHDDKYNLGLHEMAHALKLDLIKGYDFDQRFAAYFDQWHEVALKTFQKMSMGSATFLREYGGTNMHEFFAVCVEHFFEVPAQLKKEMPHIYYHLAYLLNQDPLNIEEDYLLTDKLIEEAKRNRIAITENIKKTSRYDTWHWSFSVMMAGIFGGTAVIYIMRNETLISIPTIGFFILSMGIIGLIQWPYFKKHVPLINFQQFVLYCIFGTGFCATALILLVNYFITIDTNTEEYKINNYYLTKSGNKIYVEVMLEQNTYKSMSQIRYFILNEAQQHGFSQSMNSIRYYFRKGLFGFKVLENYRFYNDQENGFAVEYTNY
jgi:MtfA peptidase